MGHSFEYSDMHRLHDECNWKTFFYDNKHNLRDVIDAIVMKHIKQKDIVEYLKRRKGKRMGSHSHTTEVAMYGS